MNWVEYKSYVRRYRLTYVSLFSHVRYILLQTIQSYAHYRKMCSLSFEAEKINQQYGIFLAHFAELENLTTGYITDPDTYSKNEWEFIQYASTILANCKANKLDDTEMMLEVAQWVRKWFPWVSLNQDHFRQSMVAFRKMMDERNRN